MSLTIREALANAGEDELAEQYVAEYRAGAANATVRFCEMKPFKPKSQNVARRMRRRRSAGILFFARFTFCARRFQT